MADMADGSSCFQGRLQTIVMLHERLIPYIMGHAAYHFAPVKSMQEN